MFDREKLKNESSVKKQMRRHNESCFIPRSYFIFGYTKKDMFVRTLKKVMKEVNRNEIREN